MEIATRYQQLRAEVKEGTAARRKRVIIERAKAFTLRSLAVALAAAITVLLGYKGLSQSTTETYSNIALILGAVITVVNAWSAFFDHTGLWVKDTVTWNRLRQIEIDMDYYAAGRANDEMASADLDEFASRYRAARDEDLRQWLSISRGGGGGEVQAPTPAADPAD